MSVLKKVEAYTRVLSVYVCVCVGGGGVFFEPAILKPQIILYF